jgi:hypothetical protein
LIESYLIIGKSSEHADERNSSGNPGPGNISGFPVNRDAPIVFQNILDDPFRFARW